MALLFGYGLLDQHCGVAYCRGCCGAVQDDANFAERTITEVMKVHDFHKTALSLSPYGTYWRVMKRIMTVEMLVQKRIKETEPIRRRCIGDMVEWISKEANVAAGGESGRIHVARFVFLASFNMLGNLVLSRDLVSPESVEGSEFFAAMIELMQWSGHPNIVDLFPWLRWLDPQGNGNDDQKQKLSEHELNVIVTEVFLAGSETTSSSIEWAMVELLSHPEIMRKAKTELAQVGKSNKFEESHIESLPYLQAVLKETLRLHPPIPFLVPRRAIQETNFMGYQIPKNTRLFVNAWSIGRDPQCWDDPLSFTPERFLGSKIDYKGQNFELIPFGAGRRICAGIPLAHRMLHLVLGSLLHEFDWRVDEIGKNAMMDTRDRIGVTVRKLVPLEAIPRRCSTNFPAE
ncbi:UNVERIFIED_CONTAM: cytochrome [Sesamum calycinum]|uniref:Cytochrome n=1 Tax=Sesamum calycinum TaxID=2727403 RepID=A0AAW2Q3T3_9LAMI